MERIKLDLVPGCVKPILRASQYDNGREWTCDILDNGVPYKFASGDSCEIHVRKGDNCAVTASVPVTAGQSYVVVTSTEQMCAVSGDNLAELVIMNGTKKIGSCNLILSVEADPLNGSKSSASEIHDLQTQVNEAVDEALSHKGASDIAFDNTGTGLEATNVQSAIEEVNTKTDEKADADSVYDKEYMDGIFEQIDNAFTGVNNSLNTKMNKANPTGTGSFSLNRKSGTTVGQYSHAEGYDCESSGQGSHAEGLRTKSTGHQASHAEGSATTASGSHSHAEGSATTASGAVSHAEGDGTTASGYGSHAEGYNTEAGGEFQHVFGKYNIIDRNNEFVEIVGNGPVGFWYERSNARTLDWSGNEWLAGDLTYNGNKSITSEVQRLDDKIDNLPAPMIFKGTLGVGGTIQTLPTASASNEGFTYKVITDGTYAGKTAKVGDVFTSNGSEWVLIPAGDEDTDTWRAIKVNGVEKLGNGISSGSLDIVDTDNIEAEFDNDGNKLKLKTKNIYTQAQVDAIVSDAIYNVLPDDTASGSVANFNTSLALPIKSLEVDVNAVQASGTPTPATPLPISGWSAVSLTRCGLNLFNDTKWFTDNGYTQNADGSWYKATNDLNVTIWENKSGYSGQITVHWLYKYDSAVASPGLRYRVLYTDGTGETVWTSQVDTFTVKDFTSASGKIVDKIVTNYGTQTNGTTIKDFCISILGNTTYEPYNGNTEVINLGGTYYGGHLTQDKAGHRQFEVTHKKYVIDGQTPVTDLSYNQTQGNYAQISFLPYIDEGISNAVFVCNIFEYQASTVIHTPYKVWGSGTAPRMFFGLPTTITNRNEALAWFTDNPTTIIAPLATPIIIDLPDGEPITTLNGTNNIYADTGDTDVVFKCSVNDYVSAHSGGNLLGMGGVYLGGAKSGGSEEETDKGEDTEKVKLDDPKEEVKTIGDTKKLGGE